MNSPLRQNVEPILHNGKILLGSRIRVNKMRSIANIILD